MGWATRRSWMQASRAGSTSSSLAAKGLEAGDQELAEAQANGNSTPQPMPFSNQWSA